MLHRSYKIQNDITKSRLQTAIRLPASRPSWEQAWACQVHFQFGGLGLLCLDPGRLRRGRRVSSGALAVRQEFVRLDMGVDHGHSDFLGGDVGWVKYSPLASSLSPSGQPSLVAIILVQSPAQTYLSEVQTMPKLLGVNSTRELGARKLYYNLLDLDYPGTVSRVT